MKNKTFTARKPVIVMKMQKKENNKKTDKSFFIADKKFQYINQASVC